MIAVNTNRARMADIQHTAIHRPDFPVCFDTRNLRQNALRRLMQSILVTARTQQPVRLIGTIGKHLPPNRQTMLTRDTLLCILARIGRHHNHRINICRRDKRAQTGKQRIIGEHIVIERAMRLHIRQTQTALRSQPSQCGDLRGKTGIQRVLRHIGRFTPETGAIRIAGMRAAQHTVRLRQPQSMAHRRFITGMAAAGDIGGVDKGHNQAVVATFADIGIKQESSHVLSIRDIKRAQTFHKPAILSSIV